MAVRPRVELEIGELVLAGFPAAQRHRIGEVVRAELERLLGEGGLPAGSQAPRAVDRLDAGTVRLAGGDRPDSAGRRIAGAVYAGLGSTGRGRP